MSKTKKAPAKKITKPAFTKEQLTAIMKRIEAGGLVITESKKAGYKHNPQIRKALTELLGSTAKYEGLLLRSMKARSGGEKKEKKQPVKAAA